MNICDFLASRPFLYHLTHRENLPSILRSRRIESTRRLVQLTGHADAEAFLRTRRNSNVVIGNDQRSFVIRDQIQIRERGLRKSLEADCTYEDFLYLLNNRVFFWPTLGDVKKHYRTYVDEGPVVLRAGTDAVFALNARPKFCRFNSGAPRPHLFYGKKPAPRGYNTFVLSADFAYIPSKVREVTFDDFSVLPDEIWVAQHPAGEFILPQ